MAKMKEHSNRLRPAPPGESELERSAKDKDPRVVERIEALARRNDPFAWRELACGYRVPRIRKPIEQALRQVGVEKVLSLIRRVEGDWPEEVIEFLTAEDRKEKSRRVVRFRPTPSLGMGHRPWWDDG